MANPPSMSLSQAINTWAQTIGIVIAAVWAVYTFYTINFQIPNAAPININLALDLKSEQNVPKDFVSDMDLIPISLTVSINNPSTKMVYLLDNAWIAYGCSISKIPEDKTINNWSSKTANKRPIEQSINSECVSVVALGTLFKDASLAPHEEINKSVVFHVARNKYDFVHVEATIPTMADKAQIAVEWNLYGNEIAQSTFGLDNSGNKSLIQSNEDFRRYNSKGEMQQYTAEGELWLQQ